MLKVNTLKHLAIIMDGNGRWATNKGFSRNKGHKAGAKNVKTITKYCSKTQIQYLTLYAFSTENWNRPKLEINALMKLLEKYLKNERETLLKNDVRFRYIGDISPFSQKLKDELARSEEATKDCKSLTQVLALNYGSKNEISRAVKKLQEEKSEINEENITNCLDTAFMPEVDLLIRTGGEKRLSNFLLWQSAYAELSFTDTLWPDFSKEELEKIMQDFTKIHRRFGGL